MKVRYLLIGVVALFVAGLLTTSGHAEIDPGTCVGLWLFDESEGKIAEDSSENKNNGALMNGPKWVDGKFGSALEFDGVDDRIEVPYNESLNLTTFYINGTETSKAKSNITPLKTTNSGVLFIGARSASSPNYLEGLIDECAIFNVALTDQDIQNIANKGLEEAINPTAVSSSGKLTTTWTKVKAR